jgi:hypothetical protein
MQIFGLIEENMELSYIHLALNNNLLLLWIYENLTTPHTLTIYLCSMQSSYIRQER